MSDNIQRLRYLLSKYAAKQCNREEVEEFYQLVKLENDETLYALLDELYSKSAEKSSADGVDWDSISSTILKQPQELPIKNKLRLIWLKKFMVAASLLCVLGVGAYLLMNHKETVKPVIAGQRKADVSAPDKSKPTITLFDGKVVKLDSIQNGMLVQEGGASILKLANGQIAYQKANGEIIQELKYNTITNPVGSKVVDLRLADGSRVWLNSGSELKFPMVFVGNERRVEISGEAYFEVASDTQKPFKVKKGDMEIVVLGTKFNVNAYDNDKNIKVTLLEGAVNVSLQNKKQLLKPNQQAILENQSIDVAAADVELVMAWKNGFFAFNGARLDEVMKQISRWYGLNIEYDGAIPSKQFGGKIYKDASLSEVMKVLEENGVKYAIKDGKTIVITTR